MNKTILYQLLALVLLFGITTTSNAQVTIGAGTKPSVFSVLELSTESTQGGLRLPHLTTVKRNTLDLANLPSGTPEEVTTKAAAVGLSIYNTDTKCVEYWNGVKWVSLCLGSASIVLKDGTADYDPENSINILDYLGGDTPELTITDTPPCTTGTNPYSITIVTGGAYTFVNMTDEASGKFVLTMSENTYARSRQAIIRVANNCNGEFKEFIFSQKGNEALCTGITGAPVVLSSSATNEICDNGAVQLYIDGASIAGHPAGTVYKWTLNDEELGEGLAFTVTKQGTYIVHAGGVGCPGLSSNAVIVKSGTSAPNAVRISANNGATICGGTPVTLRIEGTAPTGLQWYKDGYPISGAIGATCTVTAKGTYFASVSDATCQSLPSNIITIEEKAGGGAMDFLPEYVLINDKKINETIIICSDGLLDMKIDPTKIQAYTYRWYLNGVIIGTGTNLKHTIGQTSGTVKLWVEAFVPGDDTRCTVTQSTPDITVVNGSTPKNITIGGSNYYCSNQPAGSKLTASWVEAAPGTTYKWINETNLQHNTVTDTPEFYMGPTGAGKYKVVVTSAAGCVGESTRLHEVAVIGAPLVSWDVATQGVTAGVSTLFMLRNVGAIATGYQWSWAAKGAATADAGNLTGITGNTANITWTGTGEGILTVKAMGDCASAETTLAITVKGPEALVPPEIGPTGGISGACNGQLFEVTNMGAYGRSATVVWSVRSNTANPTDWTMKTSGNQNEFMFLEFTKSSPLTTVDVECYVQEGSDQSARVSKINVSGNKSADHGLSIKTEGNAKWMYDIKKTEYPVGDVCGQLANRQSFDISEEFTYSLSSMTGVTNVVWTVNDKDNGKLLLNNEKQESPKAVLKFDPAIADASSPISLVTNTTGKVVELHVSFKLNMCSYTITKDIKVSDCGGCGAKTINGGWLTFMCHNLGADESLDPFTHDDGLYGDLYQWGRRADGHEKRKSLIAPGVASGAALNAETGQIVAGDNKYGKFITNNSSPSDWRTPQLNTLWGDGTQNENMKKATGDPCPSGWKVPSLRQWNSIHNGPTSVTPNQWTWTGKGHMIGKNLYLPATGYRTRQGGHVQNVGAEAYYSTTTLTGTAHESFRIGQGMIQSLLMPNAEGLPIRCVKE